MLKAVLDSNIFVSGMIKKAGVPAQILDYWKDEKILLIISTTIIHEAAKVLRYPHIQDRYQLSESEIKGFITALRTQSIIVPRKIKLEIIKEDPTDNKFIEAAVEGQADYIVSGDSHLKDLKNYQGIEIVSPVEFLEILKS